jgi:hypothetical protein
MMIQPECSRLTGGNNRRRETLQIRPTGSSFIGDFS